jgi:hypothetical protein
MQKHKTLIIVFLLLAATSCVQKSYKKTFLIELTIKNNKKNIESVGIRGNGQPLSWNSDVAMTPLIKDSVYTAVITTLTGYKFAEIKFTVNGEFELKDKPNRRVAFSEKDTTKYLAIFDQTN